MYPKFPILQVQHLRHAFCRAFEAGHRAIGKPLPRCAEEPHYFDVITTHDVPRSLQPEGRYIALRSHQSYRYSVFTEQELRGDKHPTAIASEISLSETLRLLKKLERQNPKAAAYLDEKKPGGRYYHHSKVTPLLTDWPNPAYFGNDSESRAHYNQVYTAHHKKAEERFEKRRQAALAARQLH